MKPRKAPAKPHKHKGPARKSPAPASVPTKTPKVSNPRRLAVQTSGCFAGTPYRLTQREYATNYGKSLATIKRWWAQGKPLDDADAMGEFISPRGRKPEPDDDFEAPSIIPPTGDQEEGSPVTLDESFFAGDGILAAIERLKKAERERAAAYFAAIVGRTNAQIVQNRFKEWVGIIEALRKLAKDEPDIRKANDLTVDKADMDAAIGVIFNGFRVAARNLPPRAAAKLEGRAREHDEIVEILEREVEVLLRALVKIALDEAARAAGETPAPAE